MIRTFGLWALAHAMCQPKLVAPAGWWSARRAQRSASEAIGSNGRACICLRSGAVTNRPQQRTSGDRALMGAGSRAARSRAQQTGRHGRSGAARSRAQQTGRHGRSGGEGERRGSASVVAGLKNGRVRTGASEQAERHGAAPKNGADTGRNSVEAAAKCGKLTHTPPATALPGRLSGLRAPTVPCTAR
jgi:hypothetical protein